MKNTKLPPYFTPSLKGGLLLNWKGAVLAVCGLFLITVSSCKKTTQDVQFSQGDDVVASSASPNATLGVNVVLNEKITNSNLSALSAYGTVVDQFSEINALTMRTTNGKLPGIQSLSFVRSAGPDAERNGSPVDAVSVSDFSSGLNTWDLDAVNVTDLYVGRTIAQDGTGVYVGVLDTGLPDSWRQYFPQERIATQYAIAFGGGGGEVGNVSSQPNKWEHDQNSHGGHVTSTIIGYNFGGVHFNGVAPKTTIIPVKVLNQNGKGWSSVVAHGILYMAALKMGPLSGSPVVINMSLGGPSLDAMEVAAVDYAVSHGVIIVASAGNSGASGMGYPGGYAPVISVGSAGWTGEWTSRSWWYASNVPDPTDVNNYYISSFSSRELPGQDLDVVAPGSWVLGPYQINSGQLSWYFLGGTSMASPHVAGIVALMAQKKSSLTAAEAEMDLENAAYPMGAGSADILQPSGAVVTETWGTNATGHGFITADAALAQVN